MQKFVSVSAHDIKRKFAATLKYLRDIFEISYVRYA